MVIAYTLDEPPPPSDFSCLIPNSSNGKYQITIQWSPSFNSEHAVERYRVDVTPDPSSCSSNNVLPGTIYSCSDLDPGTDYLVSISTINCGNREGESEDIYLWREGE